MEVLERSATRNFGSFRLWLRLLVKDPVGAYNRLRELHGDGVDIVLKVILKELTDDEDLINRVVESLKKGDPRPFKQLIAGERSWLVEF